jgi:hypothetical protein
MHSAHPLLRWLVFPALLLVSLAGSAPALAHSPDQLPFLSIDGQNSQIYPVGSTSLTTLTLPQDLGPGTYLVNKPITFALLSDNLPIQAQYLAQTTFTWDFGDGSAYGHGMQQSHTYSKMGSFTVTLRSSSSDPSIPDQLLDLVLMNVLPDASYQLPKAVVKANGKQSSNPYTDILKLNLHANLQLDGSASTAPAGIASTLWDLGDQHSESQISVVHVYADILKYVLPMLRVTDKNGFFSDAFVQIEDDPSVPAFVAPPAPAATIAKPTHTALAIAGTAVAVPVIGIVWVLSRRRRSSR